MNVCEQNILPSQKENHNPADQLETSTNVMLLVRLQACGGDVEFNDVEDGVENAVDVGEDVEACLGQWCLLSGVQLL